MMGYPAGLPYEVAAHAAGDFGIRFDFTGLGLPKSGDEYTRKQRFFDSEQTLGGSGNLDEDVRPANAGI
ncbi:MAG TPA: hypothetical protein VGF82_03680 [Terracidiphilus sp.]|jgi:hypothetical protein